MEKHRWTYEENEYCVEQAVKNFVTGNERDCDAVVAEMYLNFDGKIKAGSLKMKLQNIKYLFGKYKIPNTLRLGELENASNYNEIAFLAVCRKYSLL